MTFEKTLPYDLVEQETLEEIHATVTEYTHRSTGAKILHIHNDDPENVFTILLPTHPQTSNGVAHILEHTVLCGSQKYPVRDPFFLMQRRSVATFMNAFTGSDFTAYPAASKNPKDFYNLFSVYLDAVFFPKLDPLAFAQEGIRLELTDPKDLHSTLEYKGVVFNEMKGVMSNPFSRLYDAMTENLCRGTTYEYSSGGNPPEIPNLTHQELLAFHQAYYHPSRAIFYFYGNMPIESHLEFLEENLLANASSLPPLPPIPMVERMQKPCLIRTAYPFNAHEESSQDKVYIGRSYLTCKGTDHLEGFSLVCLLNLLTDHDASPLKKGMLSSKLCKQMYAGIEPDSHEIPIAFIFQGVENGKEQALLDTFDSLLEELSRTHFSQELIESTLHQEAFSRLEISDSHYPHGLMLFFRSALFKQMGGSSKAGLRVHAILEALEKKIQENPNFFQELIKTHLLNNPHRVDVILEPSNTLQDEEEQREKEALAKEADKLSTQDRQRLVDQAEKLLHEQSASVRSSIECLPQIFVEDLERQIPTFALQTTTNCGIKTHIHECFTNDIVYANLIFPLDSFSIEELVDLQLLSYLLTEMGTQDKSYEDMLLWQTRRTGGISSHIEIVAPIHDVTQSKPLFTLAGKALFKNHEDLLKIFASYKSVSFDNHTRIGSLLAKYLSTLESSLVAKASRYAIYRSESYISASSFLQDQLNGLAWVQSVRSYVKHYRENPKTLENTLLALSERLFKTQPEIVWTCQQNHVKHLDMSALQDSYTPPPLHTKPFPKGSASKEGRIIPASVAASCTTIRAPQITQDDAQALTLAQEILANGFLHVEIREKGGAYTSGARYSSSGAFSYYSASDPNIMKTLHTFSQAGSYVVKACNENTLREAKIQAISDIDHPISPGSRGWTSYLWNLSGKNTQERQRIKDQIFSTSVTQVQDAAKKYLIDPQETSTCVCAGQPLFLQENFPYPTYSIEDPIQ